MIGRTDVIIRPFDGSRADAEGVLSVERAAFNESPYTAAEVRAMLTGGPQHAWVAVQAGRIAGFVVAFLTKGGGGPSWEIDLLAVHPDWQGQRLGQRLIQAAAARGAEYAACARAVAADDNQASLRAFLRVGFHPAPCRYDLLIYRPREFGSPLAGAGTRVPRLHRRPCPAGVQGGEFSSALLQVERAGQILGTAEVMEVQTLLYRGLWIESLVARDGVVGMELIEQSVERARLADLDEVGMLVPEQHRALQRAFCSAGFRSLGWFLRLVAPLPLPKPAEELLLS